MTCIVEDPIHRKRKGNPNIKVPVDEYQKTRDGNPSAELKDYPRTVPELLVRNPHTVEKPTHPRNSRWSRQKWHVLQGLATPMHRKREGNPYIKVDEHQKSRYRNPFRRTKGSSKSRPPRTPHEKPAYGQETHPPLGTRGCRDKYDMYCRGWRHPASGSSLVLR